MLLSEIGPYIMFYKDIQRFDPGKELESEVLISMLFKDMRLINIFFSNVHIYSKCISETYYETTQRGIYA